MKKSFVYGVAVEGDNFTDRVDETRRLKRNFENGQNVVLISPRRMGKTSLVRHVAAEVDRREAAVVLIDIYDCRSEYDFYDRLATAVLRQTSSRAEEMLRNVREFLSRLSPKVSFGSEQAGEVSLSLGITPKDYSPEEVLNMPEALASRMKKHIVICIDEFQQVGQWDNSVEVQKRMRGVWQLHKNVSYCLYGSKKHMLTDIFQNKRMPFYQFGDIVHLQPIPTADWTPFIRAKFAEQGIAIGDGHIERICAMVENQSSYVQQLSWNVMLCCEGNEVNDGTIDAAVADMIAQASPLFIQQTESLSAYQVNFLRAIASGEALDFTSDKVLRRFNLGSKSNISRMVEALTRKELIEKSGKRLAIADPVLRLWIRREWR